MAINSDFNNLFGSAMQQQMSKDEWHYRQMLEMQQMPSMTPPPTPEPEKPKKPKHLNQKLLLIKG